MAETTTYEGYEVIPSEELDATVRAIIKKGQYDDPYRISTIAAKLIAPFGEKVIMPQNRGIFKIENLMFVPNGRELRLEDYNPLLEMNKKIMAIRTHISEWLKQSGIDVLELTQMPFSCVSPGNGWSTAKEAPLQWFKVGQRPGREGHSIHTPYHHPNIAPERVYQLPERYTLSVAPDNHDGYTLNELMDTLSFEESMQVFLDILEACSYLAGNNLGNFDIKPANTFVEGGKRQKRGIMFDLEGILPFSDKVNATHTPQFAENYYYVSPDMRYPNDLKKIIFSLGIYLFQCCSKTDIQEVQNDLQRIAINNYIDTLKALSIKEKELMDYIEANYDRQMGKKILELIKMMVSADREKRPPLELAKQVIQNEIGEPDTRLKAQGPTKSAA